MQHKFALIGCGKIAERHAENISERRNTAGSM